MIPKCEHLKITIIYRVQLSPFPRTTIQCNAVTLCIVDPKMEILSVYVMIMDLTAMYSYLWGTGNNTWEYEFICKHLAIIIVIFEQSSRQYLSQTNK